MTAKTAQETGRQEQGERFNCLDIRETARLELVEGKSLRGGVHLPSYPDGGDGTLPAIGAVHPFLQSGAGVDEVRREKKVKLIVASDKSTGSGTIPNEKDKEGETGDDGGRSLSLDSRLILSAQASKADKLPPLFEIYLVIEKKREKNNEGISPRDRESCGRHDMNQRLREEFGESTADTATTSVLIPSQNVDLHFRCFQKGHMKTISRQQTSTDLNLDLGGGGGGLTPQSHKPLMT